MISSRQGLLAGAVLATLVLAWLAGRDELAAQLLVVFVTWLVVPGFWAATAIAIRDWRPVQVAFPATLFVAALLSGWLAAGVLASLALAGLVGGWALARRWRLLPVLAVTVLMLIPSVVLPMAGTTYPDAVEEQLGYLHEQYVNQIPETMSAGDREAVLRRFDDWGTTFLQVVVQFWPSMVLAGLFSQAALALLAGWGIARLVVPALARPRWGPLATWRAPFAAVWVLIGGLALSLVGGDAPALIGRNLAVMAASLVVIQGLGVQSWLVRRVMPPAGQAIFWVLGAFLFAPALIGGGALFGLADQWIDLRRLRRPPENDDET